MTECAGKDHRPCSCSQPTHWMRSNCGRFGTHAATLRDRIGVGSAIIFVYDPHYVAVLLILVGDEYDKLMLVEGMLIGSIVFGAEVNYVSQYRTLNLTTVRVTACRM